MTISSVTFTDQQNASFTESGVSGSSLVNLSSSTSYNLIVTNNNNNGDYSYTYNTNINNGGFSFNDSNTITNFVINETQNPTGYGSLFGTIYFNWNGGNTLTETFSIINTGEETSEGEYIYNYTYIDSNGIEDLGTFCESYSYDYYAQYYNNWFEFTNSDGLTTSCMMKINSNDQVVGITNSNITASQLKIFGCVAAFQLDTTKNVLGPGLIYIGSGIYDNQLY